MQSVIFIPFFLSHHKKSINIKVKHKIVGSKTQKRFVPAKDSIFPYETEFITEITSLNRNDSNKS